MPRAKGVRIRARDQAALAAIGADVTEAVAKRARAVLSSDDTPADVERKMATRGALNIPDGDLQRMQIQVNGFFDGLDNFHRRSFDRAIAEVAGLKPSEIPDTNAGHLVELSSERMAESLSRLPERARERFYRTAVKAGASEAGFGAFGLADVTELIEQTVAVNLSDGKNLANDGVSRFTGEASQFRQEDIGVDSYVWTTQRDDRVRDSHAANDSLEFSWDLPPIGTGPPGFDYNCFPGDVRLTAAGLKASVAYRYVGALVEITLASGVQLTATPNHPVLTESGWKRAGAIEEGDQLLVHRGRGRLAAASLNPELGKGNPRAEDLHRLVGGSRDEHGSLKRRVDLYGDPASRDEQIDVVLTPRELRNGFDAMHRELFGDFALEPSDHATPVLARDRGLVPGGAMLPLGSQGLVCGAGKRPAFVAAHSGKANPVRLGSGADGEPQIRQARAHHRSADPEFVGDLFHRLLALVSVPDGGVEPFPTFQVVPAARVRVLTHDGLVYDGETESGLIMANGVLLSNCRCIAEPVISEELMGLLQAQPEEFTLGDPEPVQERDEMKTRDRYPYHQVRERRDGKLIQHRRMPGTLKFRQLGESQEFEVEGYGLRWDAVADLGWFTESFQKGAFAETLEDVRFKIGHDYSRVALARSPRTMEVTEDDEGLYFRATLDLRNTDAMGLAVAIERGDVDKASIGFSYETDYEFTAGDEGAGTKDHYTITRVEKLYEISAVDFPAHESSDLGALGDDGGTDDGDDADDPPPDDDDQDRDGDGDADPDDGGGDDDDDSRDDPALQGDGLDSDPDADQSTKEGAIDEERSALRLKMLELEPM